MPNEDPAAGQDSGCGHGPGTKIRKDPMADFDFAPRPPKSSDQDEPSPFAAGDPAQNKKPDLAGPAGAARPSAFSRTEARNTARRSPADSQGMLGGLMSMVTTMALARHTNGHIDPISSPTGIMGMLKSSFGSKHDQPDDHSFELDLSRHGTAGGGLGGMSTGIGQVGGPVQNKSKLDANKSAMKAIGTMARGTGGGLGAVLGHGGAAARKQMHWLDQGVKNLYKVDR